MELPLVTFEQSKALKELGFPQETYDYLYLDEELISREEYYEMDCGGPFSVELSESECLSAPSLELVTKWLREKKHIYVSAFPNCVGMADSFARGPLYHKYQNWTYSYIELPVHKHTEKFEFPKEYLTYEEALSAGIDKAIEILKQQ